MKRYYIDGITNLDTIEEAIKLSSKNKTKRKSVQVILNNSRYYAKQIQRMIEDESFEPTVKPKFKIIDGVSKKEREIDSAPYYPDQIIHTLIITAFKPYFMKGMYELCCACVPGRGAHYGKKYVERWIKTDKTNTRYYLKLDIKKYYPSLKPRVIWSVLTRKFKDCKPLRILKKIIFAYPNMPIGLLTSQWLANFCLQELDHYIKEQLQTKYYIRYLDDMVLFGSNKKKLHKARRDINSFLKKMGLRLKGNWQLNRFNYQGHYGANIGQDLDFMGFRFFRYKTIIRKSIFLRIRRRMKNFKKRETISIHDVRAILSYFGWIKHTNSFTFYREYVLQHVKINILKRMVSDYDRSKRYQTAAFYY